MSGRLALVAALLLLPPDNSRAQELHRELKADLSAVISGRGSGAPPVKQTSARATESRPLIQWPLAALIKTYQVIISPQDGPRCTFALTCSSYCSKAIKEYGLVQGLMMCADRLERCNGLSSGFYEVDPHTGKAIDLPMSNYALIKKARTDVR